ncbi:MAG TPA: prepilin-type N-terminal cleavage/methylation domain-containing protein [Candidatus Goldiibacteriota bacterium]|nr:prepilin-type N-terminal cleavage/methylation domain-containing protein [Candidatus Goldiibacteriota bacterium]
MLKINKSKKGFTLIEAMISAAIISIVSIGMYNLLRDGMYMWNSGLAKMTLTTEGKITMTMIKKAIQQCQGTTIRISRFDSNQPANSYISMVLTEPIFVKTTIQRCGCGSTSDAITVGAVGAPVEIYQYNNYLRVVYPEIKPGTDLGDSEAVQANTYYKTLTISANVESIMFSFVDSKKGKAINTAGRFSKFVWNNKSPVSIFLKETVIVKRMHSAGYFHN